MDLPSEEKPALTPALPLNLVAADVRRLTLFGEEIRASSRRLLRFREPIATPPDCWFNGPKRERLFVRGVSPQGKGAQTHPLTLSTDPSRQSSDGRPRNSNPRKPETFSQHTGNVCRLAPVGDQLRDPGAQKCPPVVRLRPNAGHLPHTDGRSRCSDCPDAGHSRHRAHTDEPIPRANTRWRHRTTRPSRRMVRCANADARQNLPPARPRRQSVQHWDTDGHRHRPPARPNHAAVHRYGHCAQPGDRGDHQQSIRGQHGRSNARPVPPASRNDGAICLTCFLKTPRPVVASYQWQRKWILRG